MKLKILTPTGIHLEDSKVERIVAEADSGSFGILPHRRDCVAALVPGILVYQGEAGDELYVAVDEGILVKTGGEVTVSVRNAHGGNDLTGLRESVYREFMQADELEVQARAAMEKLETAFIRRFADLER